MIVAEVWNAVGGIAALVAAIAALITILYARATVSEAKLGREQSHADHLEAVEEQKVAAEAFAAAHREEMDERRRAYEADLRLQRVLQIERVSALLLELIGIARDEKENPPPPYAPPMPFTLTRIPATLIRIGIAVDVLDSLGGPYLDEVSRLVGQGYGVGTDPMQIVSEAINALRVVNSRVQNDPALKLAGGNPS